MKLLRLKFICSIIFSIAFLLFSNIAMAKNFSVDMQKSLELEGQGISTFVVGDSMLTDNGKKDQVSFDLLMDSVEKVFLLWAGEVSPSNNKYTNITLVTPQKQEIKITADTSHTKKINGIIYSCFADITDNYSGVGKYLIKGIETDNLNTGSGFTVGGYSVVIVYKNKKIKQTKVVRIYTDVLILKPGEIHEMNILPKGSLLDIKSLTVVGGHGLKGNASANLLNGLSITGGDDWDGSEGKYWDTDTFKINDSAALNIHEKGLVLSFDPVLQWVYPFAVVCEFEKTEGGK